MTEFLHTYIVLIMTEVFVQNKARPSITKNMQNRNSKRKKFAH